MAETSAGRDTQTHHQTQTDLLQHLHQIVDCCGQKQPAPAVFSQQICQLLVQKAHYTSAWIAVLDNDAGTSLLGVAGLATKQGEGLAGCCSQQAILRRHSLTATSLEHPCEPCQLAQLHQRQQVICTPLTCGDSAHGVLAIVADPQRQMEDPAGLVPKTVANLVAQKLHVLSVTNELRESQKRLRFLTDNIPDVVYSIDGKGNLLSLSERALQYYGYTEQELLGKPFLEYIFHDDRQHVLTCFIEGVQQRREATRGLQFRVMCKNGELCWVEANTNSTYDDQGALLTDNGVLRDISERKRASEAKTAFEQRLQQAQKMESIGHLAGGIAHDFNNLLAPILGYAELTLRELGQNNLSTDVKEIVTAARRAKELTQQLLAFGRRQVLRVVPLHLSQVVSAMDKMLRRLVRENIVLSFDLEEEATVVEADCNQLEQIVLNLVVNACDAMPDGGDLKIGTKALALDSNAERDAAGVVPGDYVELWVSDNGCGIAQETQSKIFEPFFTTKQNGGTGLGLSMVYGIVKQHGGHIEVETKLGRGTTVLVYLPASQHSGAIELITNEEQRAAPAGETILVVEDEETVRKLVCRALRKNGYQTLAAQDGKRAIKIAGLSGKKIDLLLTDVILPEVSGSDLYKILARDSPDLRVLYISGYTDDIIAPHGVLAEDVHFLPKPFHMSELLHMVGQALQK